MPNTMEQHLLEPTPAEILQLEISKIEAELSGVSVTASLQAVEAQLDAEKQKHQYEVAALRHVRASCLLNLIGLN
jgi:hypothetical protein